jgi:hypothetical protein
MFGKRSTHEKGPPGHEASIVPVLIAQHLISAFQFLFYMTNGIVLDTRCALISQRTTNICGFS